MITTSPLPVHIGLPMCIAFQANHPFLHSPFFTLHLLSVFICERKKQIALQYQQKGLNLQHI